MIYIKRNKYNITNNYNDSGLSIVGNSAEWSDVVTQYIDFPMSPICKYLQLTCILIHVQRTGTLNVHK